MKFKKIFYTKDFYAGLVFIFFGIVAMTEARNYQMGTASQMGAGYAPYYLGVILTIVGIITSVRSFWLANDVIESLVLRPMLIMTMGVLTFTILIKPFGLVLATLALVFISSFGGGEFRLREVAILSFVLVALALVLFVYVLKIPFKVLP